MKNVKIGLALGGGGARGLASIGAIDVLEQNDIYPDVVSGTSMGSIIAGLYATGYNYNKINDIAHKCHLLNCISINWSGMLYNGIFSLNNLKKFLSLFIPSSFSELKIPLTVVATDLDSGLVVRINNGNVLDAIIASCSVPVIFKPVIINNRYLVDGGLLEQIPSQTLIDMSCDTIYAVSCGYIAKLATQYRGLSNIAMRSIDILGKVNMKAALNANKCITISPNVERYSVTSFKKINEIIHEGRIATKLAIEQ